MLEDIKALTSPLVPTFLDGVLLSMGAFFGSMVSFLMGGLSGAVIWLFCFCVIDFTMGNIAVLKEGRWKSNLAYRGIFKKVFMFVVVVICHGLDHSLEVNFIRDSCIFAYMFNEVGSIIENIERLGYGEIIPPVVKNALALIKERGERLNGKTKE